MITSTIPLRFKHLGFIALLTIIFSLFLFSLITFHHIPLNVKFQDEIPAAASIHSTFFFKRRLNKDNRIGNGGITLNNQQATSSELQRELHQHTEVESEDWWEIQRSYEYQTTDSLGDFFLVQVEEAQVIHKQHAQMDDIQRAENSQIQQASQEFLNTQLGFQKEATNANSTSLAVEEVQQHQREDLMEVKQWQKIHVVQVNFYGLFKNEYEEERLVQYEYSLSIDAFNEWEYSAEEENQNADNLMLGYQRRSKIG
ncbi:hypothetical protein G9A89_004617 [Geosiphon pyriformis]|nr:hypothetical protein G9A89_004617 [Geosiphon pyriformis]